MLQKGGLKTTLDTIEMLPEGAYYLKVRARNDSGKTTECYDYLTEKDFGEIYGCYHFTVESDQSVTVDEKEE